MNIKHVCAGVVAGILAMCAPLAASAAISAATQQQLAPLVAQLVAILGQLSQAQAQGAAYMNSSAYQQQVAGWSSQLTTIQSQIMTVLSAASSSGGGSNGTTTTYSGTSSGCPQLSRDLEPGMQGSDIASLQQFFAHDSSSGFNGTVNGNFDSPTFIAVQRFQSRHGIASSGNWNITGYGRVGPATRSAIAAACAALNQQTTQYTPPTNWGTVHTGTGSTGNTTVVQSNTSSGSIAIHAVSGGSANSTIFTVNANPNASCSATVFTLSFGDGGQQELNFPASCSTQAQTVLHTYASAGSYTTQLQSGSFRNVMVVSIPIGGTTTTTTTTTGTTTTATTGSVNISAAAGTVSYAVTVTLVGYPGSACTATSYTLNFGDGSQQTVTFSASCNSQTLTFNHTYPQANTYQISITDSSSHSSTISFTSAAIVSAGTGDPLKILMVTAEGANNSSTFTDTSVSLHTLTTIGGAKIDTSTSAVDDASARLDGTGAISTPAGSDFNFGSGTFTQNLWFALGAAPSSATKQSGLIMQAGSNAADSTLGGAGLELFGDKLAFVGSIGGVVYHPFYNNTVMSSHIAVGDWHHGALVRSGNTVTLFLDGVSQGSIAVSGIARASSNALTIGRYGEYQGNYFNGWVDQVEISKGIARWTTNFDPVTGGPVVTPGDPTSPASQCNTAGTQATFSWGTSKNALSYIFLLNDTANDTSSCSSGWLCSNSTDQLNSDGSLTATSYTATVVPEHAYTWAVIGDHNGTQSNIIDGDDFTCHAPGTTTTTTDKSRCELGGGTWLSNETCYTYTYQPPGNDGPGNN